MLPYSSAICSMMVEEERPSRAEKHPHIFQNLYFMHKFIATVIVMAMAVVPCIGGSLHGEVPRSDSPADTTQTRKGGKIDGVTVYGINSFSKNSSANTINVNADYLKANFSGSLMQTLSSLPGIQAMSIGSGQ